GLVVILAVFGALVPGFFAERNLINILQQSSINACLALGMTLVIISGGIDLSVGPTAALSAVISASMLVAGVPF
ncbi:MAG: ribose ABC transporter permease, partial [Mesorhizobium sp.]